MTDCSSFHGSTSSSSDVPSSRGGGVTRIRIIRMVRTNSRRVLLGPENSASFGFAVRGGREFGTGFFVSRVDKGSEADIKGLRVGDQVIRANGYHVDDAVHKEFSQFVSSQDRLTLKVRGVGMLPVREKTIDPLTWHIVPHRALTSLSGLDEFTPKDVRIVLNVAPRTKLGLGICKGPEWKPGIFVQFTKEFGIARDAGLRPGDQILSCNSIDFSDVLFSEAVAVMKSSQTLEMIVRTGAGLDLFPGESSGYNSSASSVTGDQSPCWGDQSSKRLSIVREESYSDRHDRINLDRRKNDPSCQNDRKKTPNTDTSNNKTIIQLSEKGTLINNTMISNTNTSVHLHNGSGGGGVGGLDNVTIKQNSNLSTSTSADGNLQVNFSSGSHDHPTRASDSSSGQAGQKIADICFVSRQSETKTVIVEVHRSAAEENNRSPASNSCGTMTNNNNNSSVPAPPPKPPAPGDYERCSSVASNMSSGNTSLCSALQSELKKRQERRGDNQDFDNLEMNLKQQPKRIGNPSLGGGKENEIRHNALMDEFKRAHRKMFKNGFQEDSGKERQDELKKAVVMRDEVDYRSPAAVQQPNVRSRTADIQVQFPTPPPPPPQFANGTTTSNFKYQNNLRRQTNPPDSPSPDYDSTPSHTLPKNSSIQNSSYTNGSIKGTIARVTASELAKANGDAAELESIESFKLQNPSSPVPRPPSLYFAPQNSGPPTMKKTNRPVSVTIGEYGGQNGRKEPSKFDFIAKSNDNLNGNQPSPTNDVTQILRSELEMTLSRSNLKKRNELNGDPAKALSSTQNGVSNGLQNGRVNGSQNGVGNGCKNSVTNGSQNGFVNGSQNGGSPKLNGFNNKPVLQKTQSSNIEKLASMLRNRQSMLDANNQNSNSYNNGSISSANRVTISIPSKPELRKTESTPPTPTNGILKNGFNKPSFGEKNITFGN